VDLEVALHVNHTTKLNLFLGQVALGYGDLGFLDGQLPGKACFLHVFRDVGECGPDFRFFLDTNREGSRPLFCRLCVVDLEGFH